ncbi:hypothetical protein FRB94_002054 [Tulasnella sp. JGI-2019a]|nr:hypothetical protein FRB94_002054 [Tulasnella sp. JGI-2019a]KAG9035717.1 hypothetical protein FRB95_010782 [Tulasnella sp. JGI-2019a]
MSSKESKGSSDGTRGWARALLKKFTSSKGNGPTPDTPPPYASGESSLCHETPMTSPARIMGIDNYGRVLGYIGPGCPTASWFNFQPAEEALILEVPLIGCKEGISGSKESSELFRLHIRNPTEAAAAGNFHFLGVQYDLILLDKGNEAWALAACDEGKSGPVFKDRAKMLTSKSNADREGNGFVGNPASSKVWSIHAIEGDCEELRLNWPETDGTVVPLKATSQQSVKEVGGSHHLWARRDSFVNKVDIPVRLIVERCAES